MSKQYTLPSLPCTFPTAPIPDFIDTTAVSAHFVKVLETLSEDDLAPDAMWRDSFALTGTFRTFYSAASIMEAWRATAKAHNQSKFSGFGQPRIMRPSVPGAAWVTLGFKFETTGTPATTCSGFLSVFPTKEGTWKIWMIQTILEQLIGQSSVDEREPVDKSLQQPTPKSEPETNSNGTNGILAANGVNGINGVNGTNGAHDTKETNGVNGTHSVKRANTDFDCVVIGGGQAGLSTGGRLGALGISYVILEKHPAVGDSWKSRYDSTKLHTIREFAHLPFERTFPDTYPEFLTKNHLAEGYLAWAKKYDINIWCSTSFETGSWDAETSTWTLIILRDGKKTSITCSYVVYATGSGSFVPLKPTYANPELFKGITLHSADYKSSSEWTGKHGVVVGTANTGHDVAEDMLAAGLSSVTMVQRSPTFVVPAEHYKETHAKAYNAFIPIDLADRMFFSGPAVVGRILGRSSLHGQAALEPERFDALERVGFKLDRDGDMSYHIFERFGGHYMDVGASKKISDGKIKIKSDSLPVAWSEDGLVCENGDILKADVVVFATGFLGNLRLMVAEAFGSEVGNQVEDFWGLDEEGELRGAYKPSGHPGLFYHGGAVGSARYFSRFIALQIKARLIGTPLPVYNETRRTQKAVL